MVDFLFRCTKGTLHLSQMFLYLHWSWHILCCYGNTQCSVSDGNVRRTLSSWAYFMSMLRLIYPPKALAEFLLRVFGQTGRDLTWKCKLFVEFREITYQLKWSLLSFAFPIFLNIVPISFILLGIKWHPPSHQKNHTCPFILYCEILQQCPLRIFILLLYSCLEKTLTHMIGYDEISWTFGKG